MEEDPRRLRGATGAAHVAELGLLAVPDLLWAWLEDQPLPDTEPVAGSATFKDCAPPPEEITYRRRVKAILLDASTPAGLAEIVARQSRLVSLAEQHGRFVALLDVPQHLDARGIARWRASFNSSYCAAYHPWLGVLRAARMVGSAAPVGELVPPSSFAAGIIAARERRLGLPWGPGNELAAGAVIAAATVTAPEHDLLHPLGINVFRGERDGHRLTAARTLSTALHLRQLSVRRLLTMLRLAVERDMQWVVFEPSTPALRELIRHTLLVFLRELYRAGAFAGDTEVEAFFVRVDDSLNPPASIDLGRLIVEIGVAPVEPLEFLILRITRDGDGGVRVEEKTTDG
jgi:phage tail sheath protein FI